MTRSTLSRLATTARLVAPLAALTLVVSACGEESEPSAADPTAGEADVAAGDTLTVENPWIKTAEEGMTAAYGDLMNPSGEDIVVVGASSSISPEIELHETVMDASGAMVMQPIEGGLVVPAGGSRTLEPGGDHVMFLDLTTPVAAGEEVEVLLELEDGSTIPMTASARDHAGGDENYVGGDGGGSTEAPGGMDMDGMDMDGMDMGSDDAGAEQTSAPSDR